MKIRTGGGGVDKNGKPYKLPEKTVEAPDDVFYKGMRLIFDMPREDSGKLRQEPRDV